MGLSRRKRIMEVLLETDVPLSPIEIGHMVGTSPSVVIKDLPYVEKTARAKGYRFVIVPARCKKCGYVFEPSVHIPTKCPRCHSQWLVLPRFRLTK